MTTAIASKQTELSGCISRVIWRSADCDYIIARLQSGMDIKGKVRPDDFPALGVPYKFQGRIVESEEYGQQFQFTSYVGYEPVDRAGTVAYLKKHIPGFGGGGVRAHQLVDLYGSGAISVLKTRPGDVAEAIVGLTPDKAKTASEELIAQSAFQETKIHLHGLLEKRGFGQLTIDRAVKEWGVFAPKRIQRDPFCFLSAKPRFSGVGFLKCDRLYNELGLPADKLKRQVLALVYIIETDNSGSTWFREDWLIEEGGKLVSGNYQPEKAIRAAVLVQLLIRRQDEDGVWWIADWDGASDEQLIAKCVEAIL